MLTFQPDPITCWKCPECEHWNDWSTNTCCGKNDAGNNAGNDCETKRSFHKSILGTHNWRCCSCRYENPIYHDSCQGRTAKGERCGHARRQQRDKQDAEECGGCEICPVELHEQVWICCQCRAANSTLSPWCTGDSCGHNRFDERDVPCSKCRTVVDGWGCPMEDCRQSNGTFAAVCIHRIKAGNRAGQKCLFWRGSQDQVLTVMLM
jgi:hypothetical protein